MSDALQTSFDVVVVGSGFGGSVIALRLAEAGRSVLVLERGQPYPPGSFPRTPARHAHQLLGSRADGLYGMFDLWSFDRTRRGRVQRPRRRLADLRQRDAAQADEETFVRDRPRRRAVRALAGHARRPRPALRRRRGMQRPAAVSVGRRRAYAATHKTRAMLEAAQADGPGLPAAAAGRRLRRGRRRPAASRRAAPRGAEPNLHGAPRSTCRLCGECDVGLQLRRQEHARLHLPERGASRRGADPALLRGHDDRARAGRRGRVTRSATASICAARERTSRAPARSRPARRTAVVRARRVVLAAGAVGTHAPAADQPQRRCPGSAPRWARTSRATATRWPSCATAPSATSTDNLAVTTRGTSSGAIWTPARARSSPPRSTSPTERSPSGRPHELQDAGAPAFSEWMWQALSFRATCGRRGDADPAPDRTLRGRRRRTCAARPARLLGDAHASAAMMPCSAWAATSPTGATASRAISSSSTGAASPRTRYYWRDATRDCRRFALGARRRVRPRSAGRPASGA